MDLTDFRKGERTESSQNADNNTNNKILKMTFFLSRKRKKYVFDVGLFDVFVFVVVAFVRVVFVVVAFVRIVLVRVVFGMVVFIDIILDSVGIIALIPNFRINLSH